MLSEKVVRMSDKFTFVFFAIFLFLFLSSYFNSTWSISCTSSIIHTFKVVTYYASGAASIGSLIDDAEVETIGPGNTAEGYTFVTCCVDFQQSGSSLYTTNTDLISICNDTEYFEARDIAHLEQVESSSDHGLFATWTYPGVGGRASQEACWVENFGWASCLEEETSSGQRIVTTVVVEISGTVGPSDVILAHEHGHIHGLEHWLQGDDINIPPDHTEGNLMWGGGASSGDGLEDWQCLAEQYPNRPDPFPDIGIIP